MSSHLNWLVTPLVLAPNIAFLTRVPNCLPTTEVVNSSSRRAVEMLEHISRIGVFAIPFFYGIHLQGHAQYSAAAAMLICIAVYYAGWARYFAGKRAYPLLYQPLAGVPLPMALAPALYFLAASVLLRSMPLLCASLVFAAAHIWLSEQERRRVGS